MPRRLIYAPRAREDLDAVRRWLTATRLRASRLAQAGGDPGLDPTASTVPSPVPVGQHPGVRELPGAGGYRALYEVIPDTGRDETAGDVRVLRIYGPGQDRSRL